MRTRKVRCVASGEPPTVGEIAFGVLTVFDIRVDPAGRVSMEWLAAKWASLQKNLGFHDSDYPLSRVVARLPEMFEEATFECTLGGGVFLGIRPATQEEDAELARQFKVGNENVKAMEREVMTFAAPVSLS